MFDGIIYPVCVMLGYQTSYKYNQIQNKYSHFSEDNTSAPVTTHICSIVDKHLDVPNNVI